MAFRLLIADDNALSRSAIQTMVATDPDFEVVGEAEDGYQALQLVAEREPDLVLMDLNMPRCDGLLATRLIKRQYPKVVVVVLTVSDDVTDLFEAIRAGAQGYLLKTLDPQDWLTYLRGFAQGNWTVPREMAARILGEFGPAGAAAPVPVGLTDREIEVLRLVARAKTNREIAESLVISEQTVKNHLKNILQKLQLRNRVDLAVYAQRLDNDTEGER